MKIRHTLVGTALATALLLTACGSPDDGKQKAAGTDSSPTNQSSSPSDPGDPALAFAKCMRQNGVPKFPDPNANGGTSIGPGTGVNPDSPQYKSADKKCRSKLDVQQGGVSQEVHDQLLKYSECMRNNGIESFPDPVPGGGLQIKQNNPELDPRSPAYRSADKKCKKFLPEPPEGADKPGLTEKGGKP